MWYMGSKNRLSKYLVPIIESYIDEKTEGYMEPFVGGANIIDKVNCDNKIGYDIHKELIALLNYIKVNDKYKLKVSVGKRLRDAVKQTMKKVGKPE